MAFKQPRKGLRAVDGLGEYLGAVTNEHATLERRAADRRALVNTRARELRASVPELTACLRAHGASQVVLFGSLVEGDAHEASDIDLAVTGLPVAEYWNALAAVAAIAPGSVDVVRTETASSALMCAIRRGVVVDG